MLSITRLALGNKIIGLSLRGKASLAATMVKYRRMRKPTEPQNWAVDYQEKYIPFSKSQLVEALVKEFHSSNHKERISFLQFVSQVDSSLVHHYYSVLEQLQKHYTPIDPDRDTLQEFCLTDAERLMKEQKVLAMMEPLLDQANFNKLSEEALAYALIVNHPHDEVQVTVNLDQYEYITFWALGQRIGPLRVMAATRAERTGLFGTARIPADRHYFKRVIVAARTKNSHLVLKCFKDIPLEGLEQLLPLVKVRTSIFHRALLNTMLVVSGLALFVNVGMVVLSDLKIGTTTLLFLFAALMAFRAWKVFGQRRNIHSLELVHMLYYRSTSNNSELLDALTLRAQEEHAKEVILAHSFLLQHHQQQQQPLPKETRVETDSNPVEHVRKQVEAWLHLRSGLEINFCAERACQHLKELGVKGAAHPVIG
ncbi:transmembrane protein 143 isoform X1 [Notechis scutatus]|uniref:Transmembrane protein 143 isoform X1 n=1 Tax=Notechis scutatus TaxID=8663 RepID=A0A6J1VE99_9SAUR|nr:transmembrane protein 143 isoform X1 [Notechis scutatus]XP_026538219.1 transmembrane protein 143 isoform X1 [Notechis scutatus]